MIDFQAIDKAFNLETHKKKASDFGQKYMAKAIYALAEKFNISEISRKTGVDRHKTSLILQAMGKKPSIARGAEGEKNYMWNTIDEKRFIDRMERKKGRVWLKTYYKTVKNRRYDRGVIKVDVIDHIERRLGI